MPSEFLSDKDEALAADLTPNTTEIWTEVAGASKRTKLQELIAFLVAEGLVQVDGNGNIVTAGLIPQRDTAANVVAMTGTAGELVTTSDTNETFLLDGSTAGGTFIGGTYFLTPSPTTGVAYQLPSGIMDMVVTKPTWSTNPEEAPDYPGIYRLFKLPATPKVGQKITFFINSYTGTPAIGPGVVNLFDTGALMDNSDVNTFDILRFTGGLMVAPQDSMVSNYSTPQLIWDNTIFMEIKCVTVGPFGGGIFSRWIGNWTNIEGYAH